MTIILERKPLIFAKPFDGEQPEAVYKAVRERLRADGFEQNGQPVFRPFRKNNLPRNSVIATDNLVRFVTNSVADVAYILFLLVERGCEIRVYPPAGPIVVIDHSWWSPLRVLGDEVRRNNRSQNIKAGQFAAAYHRNMTIGRRPVLTDAVEQAILILYSENKSLRETEVALKSQGMNVSRSTVQRFLAAVKVRK